MIEIKRRGTGEIIYTAPDATTFKEAVETAVKAGISLAGADMAGADMAGAYMAGADMAGAYMAGADMAGAYMADADMADADMADANMARADMAGAYMAGAYMAGAYMAGAYMAGANMAGADMAGADMAGATLPAGFDLARTASTATDGQPPREWKRMTREERMLDYRARHPEVPVVDKLDTKIRDAIDHGALTLEMGAWHTCGTTHCRGGSAVHLAGDAGYALEAKYGPERAARMIYIASTGRAPHFYATNERALEDIRRRAAEEAA